MKSLRGLIEATPATPVDSGKVDWESLDWRYSNDVLARQINSSSTTVAKKRKLLNKPKSTITNWKPKSECYQ